MTGMKKIEPIIKPVVKRKPQPTYYVPPKKLPAFPDAIPVRNKGNRKRWKDYKKKKIYEWDYQHGELERWSWNGKNHEGAFDPNDGEQLKPPDPTKKPISPTIKEE
jgi:hypothetical protein